MKKYIFKMRPNTFSTYLTPIREKHMLIKFILSSVEMMLITRPSEDFLLDNLPYIILVKGKFSRLFFLSENKIFSITFPFDYHPPSNEEEIGKCYYNGIDIDFGITSRIREIIDKLSVNFNIYSNDRIEEMMDDIDVNESENLYRVLTELLIMEDAYIRYDYDPEHENGHLHPLHHYDIFYHSNNTFKIGLNKKCEFLNMLNLLNNSENRHYINND